MNNNTNSGISFAPSSVNCATPVDFTTTIKLPASVKAGDLISESFDGKVMVSDFAVGSDSTFIHQADGSWLATETSSAANMQTACTANVADDSHPGVLSPGNHTLQVLDAGGKVLAQGSYTVQGTAPGSSGVNKSTTPTARPTPTLAAGLGSIVFAPAKLNCGNPVDFSITIKLPATVKSDDELAETFDGQTAPDTLTIGSDQTFVQQANGSWLATVNSDAASMQTTCANGGLNSSGTAVLTPGTHTMQILDAKGKVLAQGSYTVAASTATAKATATPGFSTTDSLLVGRDSQQAVLLTTGEVLIVGGYDGTAALPLAEVYNPTTGQFKAASSMGTARENFTATRLQNGQVLVAGGSDTDDGPAYASAELYDPETGQFTPTGSMTVARDSQTATLLANGKVLITGGYTGSLGLASAELYDPASGTFSATGSMATARDLHTATLLKNGQVLIVGGYAGHSIGDVPAAELYNPTTGKFTVTGALKTPRDSHTATLLANGQVLVVGGWNGTTRFASAELYNPTTGVFTVTGSLSHVRDNSTATLLPNGQVLIAGGWDGTNDLAITELYIPSTGKFVATVPLAAARELNTATLLTTGQVLIVGGYNDTSRLSSCELYQP